MSLWDNKAILMAYGGLTALTARTLPTINSESKVFILLRTRFITAQGVIEDLRKGAEKLPEAEREARWREVLKGTQEIADVPDALILTEKDLPQRVVTKDPATGQVVDTDNRRGVTDIMIALGPLFKQETVLE